MPYYQPSGSDERVGPVPFSKLAVLYGSSAITSDTPVQSEGSSLWQPLRTSDLLPAFCVEFRKFLRPVAHCFEHCRNTPCGAMNGNLENDCGNCNAADHSCHAGATGYSDWCERRLRLSVTSQRRTVLSSDECDAWKRFATLPPTQTRLLALGVISSPNNGARRAFFRRARVGAAVTDRAITMRFVFGSRGLNSEECAARLREADEHGIAGNI